MAEKPSYEELERRVKKLEREARERKNTEKALRESEERLSQIIQSLSIPALVIDKNHIITHYNKAQENLSGIPSMEAIGSKKQWMAFYTEQRPVLADFIVDEASEDQIAEYYKDKFRPSSLKDGAYEAENFFPNLGENGKWIFFTASPLRDADGNVIGAIETLQDMTERKKAEEELRKSEKRYKTLLDFTPYPIIFFTMDEKVSYLNPAFTKTFGWTLEELEGKELPYVPMSAASQRSKGMKKLHEEKILSRHKTKRLTKDGRVLDVILRAAIFSEREDGISGELVILRDITREMKIARNNEAMLRISTALPQYPDLDELLNFIINEVRDLLDSEGSTVALLDEAKQEIFFCGAAYDDSAFEKKILETRFPKDRLIVGRVIKSGESEIINDVSKESHIHFERDKILGHKTKNMIIVPLKSSDRIIGALSAINKKEGVFDHTDLELMNIISGTVVLSIENARYAAELKKSYKEVTSLNRAKDKVINHLSHELRTPVAVLSASLSTLSKRLVRLPEETWKPTIARSLRNLNRILEIQYQVDDIMQDKDYKVHHMLSILLDECADELEALIAEEAGEGETVKRIREKIDDLFGPKETTPEKIFLDEYVKQRITYLKSFFLHRLVDIIEKLEPVPPILIPRDILDKTFDGLLKNAIENTPDMGRIEISMQKKGEWVEMHVTDYGVGITKDAQHRIFEGFFTTQEILDYSTKTPFDFNAGGKGADLLRMKIFSERFNFQLSMKSSRCVYIPKDSDICPGNISKCKYCKATDDCLVSGGTTFSLYFPVIIMQSAGQNPPLS